MSDTRQGGKNKFPSRRQLILKDDECAPWWMEDLKRRSPDVYEALITRVPVDVQEGGK